MTHDEKEKIIALQKQGLGYTKIANILDLPVNTIKSYCYRHPIINEIPKCLTCGSHLDILPHTKTKKFCSDKCRMTWWNSHKNKVRKQAYYSFVCAYCGKEFQSYGNAKRKYCSRSCSSKMRTKGEYKNGTL